MQKLPLRYTYAQQLQILVCSNTDVFITQTDAFIYILR
jgi:hypothetical protein